MQIRLCTRRIIEAIFSSFTYSYLLLSSASAAAPCERDSDAPNTNTRCLMRGRCLEFSRRLALTPSLRSVWSSKQLGPVTTKRCVPWTPVAQAAKANSSRIDVAAARQRDTKQLARAFRSVPVVVVTLSKNSSRPAEDLSDEYAEKIRRYAPFTACQLRTNPKKALEPDVVVQAEGIKVLQSLQPQDRVVALDERGRDVTSEGFAKLIAAAGDASAARLVFCIGGPFGHAQSVIDRADDVIRLSSCVLNHQVANIVLLEQLYRGYNILQGSQYHH